MKKGAPFRPPLPATGFRRKGLSVSLVISSEYREKGFSVFSNTVALQQAIGPAGQAEACAFNGCRFDDTNVTLEYFYLDPQSVNDTTPYLRPACPLHLQLFLLLDDMGNTPQMIEVILDWRWLIPRGT